MTRREADGLIEHERKILAAIRAHFKRYGYCPSYRDIGEAIGNHSLSHIRRGLEALEKRGLIRWERGRSRAIQLVEEFDRVADALLRLPIAGLIQAGEPIHIPGSDLAPFDSETYIDVPRSRLPHNADELFALQVKGDSMIDAMIADGDIVVFREVKQFRNGMMVAAWLPEESETTLKYYHLENGRVRLQPANPAYKPLFFPPEKVQVQGEVVFVYREY
jgi:repressor LexA